MIRIYVDMGGIPLRKRHRARDLEGMSHFDKAELGLAGILVIACLISAYRSTGSRRAKLSPDKLAGMQRGSYAIVAALLLITLRIVTH